MMFDTILGLPVHPLVVHATAVTLPVAAVAVALAALWPGFRRRAGAAPLVLSVLALALVPISVQSGQALADRVEDTALVETHRNLGESLLPWAVTLALAAAALLWLRSAESRRTHATSSSRLLLAGLTLFALIGAVGATVQIVRIGHSGTEAAWSDVARTAP